LRLTLSDLTAAGAPDEQAAELPRLARRRRCAVHPHLCRSVEDGVEGPVQWSVEAGAELAPLATYLRECPHLPGKLRVVLDLWEALAYLHHLGLVHGCVCPGTLWAGQSGGAIGGLNGVGVIAGLVGRAAVLQSQRSLPEEHSGSKRTPSEQDVHDLAEALTWLADWPAWLEETLVGVQTRPKPAGQVAATIETMGRENLREADMARARQARDSDGATRARRDDATLSPFEAFLAAIGTLFRGALGALLTGTALFAAVALAVLLTLGPAPELRTVPNLVGMSLDDAKQRTGESQLNLKLASYDFSTDVAEGRVIRTDPYPGKLVRAGREVRATLSRGHREAKVPDLEGVSLATATEKLTALNLELGEVRRQASDKGQDVVLSQTPAARKVLPRSGRVDLVVSGGPDFGTLRVADGTRYVFRTVAVTVPQGKDLQFVSVEVRGGEMDRSFEDRLCRPGETVRVDIYGPRGARVRVKIEDERVYSESL
jgi:hypothetical protein